MQMTRRGSRWGLPILAAGFLVFGGASAETPLGHGVFDCGEFFVGCNYWASHAGMYMWRNWDGAQVEKDLNDLASCGMTVLRVFPLWPDFQPLTAEFGGAGSFRGFAQAGGSLRNYAAVDDEMIGRFRFLCDAAEKRGIRLVVGLITGWMSGRMFAPTALERMNALTDPESVMWQVRFVRYFVDALKDHPAIAAWDLGNECNCMGQATAAEFWSWMHQIASEIRVRDPSRPVVSGMHSLKTTADARSNFRQQRELLDVLTTHPYPLWTPNCNTEPFDAIRNGCHAACESTLYANLAGRTCFVEEAGSMGPGVVSEERAAASMRTALFSCWSVGLPGYCWWCAYDQDRLAVAPYDWTAIERELGLFQSSGKPKPTALELKSFAAFLKALPFKLPPRSVNAVAVMTEREDCWPAAQGAWLLAREAGFDIRYALAEDPLPESDFYILPSGTGYETYSRTAFWRVMDKAKSGATVLVTLGEGAILSNLRETAGVKVENHYRNAGKVAVEIDGKSFAVAEPYRRILTAESADVLAKDSTGNPALTVNSYGKGKVVFFNAAIERNAPLAGWPVYAVAAKMAGVARKVTRTNPLLGLTEHPVGDGETIVVAINYSSERMEDRLAVSGVVDKVWRGDVTQDAIRLEANEAAVFRIR